MKIEINIEKKYVFLIVSLIIVLIGVIGVYASWDNSKLAFHSADDVKVTIKGQDYSLQEAINQGLIYSRNLTDSRGAGYAIAVSWDELRGFQSGVSANGCNSLSSWTWIMPSYFNSACNRKCNSLGYVGGTETENDCGNSMALCVCS